MGLLFDVMLLLCALCGMGLVTAFVLHRSTARVTAKRVETVLHGMPDKPQAVKRAASHTLRKKVFATVQWARGTMGMSIGAELAERFERAGIVTQGYRDLYVMARLVGPILGLIAGSFLHWNRVMFMMGLPGVLYLGPDILLTRLTKARRKRVQRGVPDAVDLLVICVDAGLGLDQAMMRVAHELHKRHPDIQHEFMRINREQRAGKQRLEAWKHMADRNQLVEIDGFVNMLMQTERFGTPIARALATYSDGIRQKRRQHAEELAAKTTVKIIFPLVLCIFPSLFVVLLGPTGIKFARGMTGLP